MALQLTKRDLELMRWVNGLGFVTTDQIARRFDIALPTAYGRIKKLATNRYLNYERIFFGAPGVYQVSLAGALVSGSTLPPLKKIPLATYYHDLKVVDVSLQLGKRLGGSFVSERELRLKSDEPIGRGGHLCDGVFVCDDKRIAIEVEISKKGRKRREKIVDYYTAHFEYDEVWYFCGSSGIKTAVESSAKGIDFLKTRLLDEFLGAEEARDE